VQKTVIDRFDHTNLNFDERFTHEVPTTENLCIAIHNLLAEHFVHADLERVRVEETRNNFFEYAGKGKHGTSISRS
jgi:6-pyruvoyltetrahydropterin/6-carboxytetrahydropterin synthase